MKAGEAARAVAAIYTTFGVRGAWRRGLHEIRRKSNRYLVFPSALGDAVRTSTPPAGWSMSPDPAAVRRTTDAAAAMERALRVLAGEHQAYRVSWLPRPRVASQWHVHPVTGYEYPRRGIWHRIPHLRSETGDIKDVWEPARFGWAFDLMRGWMLTGDDRYAEAFWGGFESFSQGCPPFMGVQWSCGQETAIRAAAWLWVEGALARAPSSTASRMAALRESLAWSGERIADALGYGLSQRNNHGISEATALVLLGARFSAAHPEAPRWLRIGSDALEQLISDQFAPDGWYIQHSFNYQRLAIDQLILAERALRAANRGLSHAALDRVRAGIGLLLTVCDGSTGELPHHGAIDGAYVLPLTTAPFRDFRPTLTAAAATFGIALPEDIHASREALAWLRADSQGVASRRLIPRLDSGPSGWAHAVTGGARLFARAGEYSSRPGHLDAMHVDVWIQGRAVATDAGSYRYAASAPWNNALAAEEVHNTVTIPGHPQAVRGPRFLWLDLPRAIVRGATLEEGRAVIRMENLSWQRQGIFHRRRCELSGAGVAVVDEIEAPAGADLAFALHWLIDGTGGADDLLVRSSIPCDVSIVRGMEGSVRGWMAEGYGVKRSATSVRIEGRVTGAPVRIATGFGDARRDDLLEKLLRSPDPLI
ncbi:MAG: heparinase II/III family protein [Gemmatimonadota bacterium]|nr:heparinase II/III family protein [Gemmatimonadota bacterium]